MTVTDRRTAIIEYLQAHEDCDINEIIDQFDVTPATIRRDLSYLEDFGRITRTYGAVHLVKSPPIPGFLTRSTLFTEERQAIAKVAYTMVNDGDSVLLDSGPTVYAVANELKKRDDITIITNSLAILSAIEEPKHDILLTGGIFDYKNLALIGPDVEHFLDQITASVLFLETSGIRGCDGLTVLSPFHARVKQKMIQCAKKRILVISNMDYSPGTILFAPFTDIDTIIVPHPIEDTRLSQFLEQSGVEVIIAKP